MRSLFLRQLQIILLALIFSFSGQGLPPADEYGVTNPVYLGRMGQVETIELGGSIAYPNGSSSWSPIWPHEHNVSPPIPGPLPRFFPAQDPLDISEYHVPSIVEFLSPDYRSRGIDYSYYVPALGNFANSSWTSPKNNYIYHVPAIASFLENDWQPSGPEFDQYPLWIYLYLNY